MTTATQNHGWTWFGKKYHIAQWSQDDLRGTSHWWLSACKTTWLDQTVFGYKGQPTGRLVPLNLKPCKRCFPEKAPQ